jgi:hypothetical protein
MSGGLLRGRKSVEKLSQGKRFDNAAERTSTKAAMQGFEDGSVEA